ALKYAGVEGINDSMIADLRSEARNEFRRMYRVQNGRHPEPKAEKKELQKSKRKWGWKVAAPIIPVLALAAYAGREHINSYSDSGVSDSQPRTSEILESNSPVRLPSFISDIGKSVAEVVKPIPKVEELGIKREGPFTLWGVDFSDSEVGFKLAWDSPEVLEKNNGQPLELILYPVAKSSTARFPSECLYSADLDCALAFDNFILIGGHSSSPRNSQGERVDLAMEPLRYFLEGKKMGENSQHWNVEERDFRQSLLENQADRPNLIYDGQAITQPAIAFVRIQEAFRDDIYRDWSKAVEAALRADPTLATKINLEAPVVVLATCGWRLPGDKLSPNNQNWFTSSVYLAFIGEPAEG
ncbi:hypothetical protein HY503_00895, partial [Candidatus Woesebacteria bacterium]|nr:hypothetical protein [Candidatus Woesebacteria bacterium]